MRLTYSIWLSLCVLFLLAQTISLLHAETHPFHQHDGFCDLVEKAAEPRIDAPPLRLVIAPTHSALCHFSGDGCTAPHAVFDAFKSRAPPDFSVSA